MHEDYYHVQGDPSFIHFPLIVNLRSDSLRSAAPAAVPAQAACSCPHSVTFACACTQRVGLCRYFSAIQNLQQNGSASPRVAVCGMLDVLPWRSLPRPEATSLGVEQPCATNTTALLVTEEAEQINSITAGQNISNPGLL